VTGARHVARMAGRSRGGSLGCAGPRGFRGARRPQLLGHGGRRLLGERAGEKREREPSVAVARGSPGAGAAAG
jgi:hypothetical protein